MFLLEDLHKTVTFHSLLTFGDVVGFFHYVTIFIQLANSCCHCQVRNISHPEDVTEDCLLLFIPSFVIASCWREDAEVCCSLGLGCFHRCLSLCQGWARLACGSRGRLAMQSGAPGQDALWQLIRRLWWCPGSGVTAVSTGNDRDVPCSLADGRFKSAALTWFPLKTSNWTVGESSLTVVGYPDTESFQRGRRPIFSISVISVPFLGCSNIVLCGIAVPFSGVLKAFQNNWFTWCWWENKKVLFLHHSYIWGSGNKKLIRYLDVMDCKQAYWYLDLSGPWELSLSRKTRSCQFFCSLTLHTEIIQLLNTKRMTPWKDNR